MLALVINHISPPPGLSQTSSLPFSGLSGKGESQGCRMTHMVRLCCMLFRTGSGMPNLLPRDYATPLTSVSCGGKLSVLETSIPSVRCVRCCVLAPASRSPPCTGPFQKPWLLLAHGQQPIRAQESPARSCDANEVFSASSLGRPSPTSWYGCA